MLIAHVSAMSGCRKQKKISFSRESLDGTPHSQLPRRGEKRGRKGGERGGKKGGGKEGEKEKGGGKREREEEGGGIYALNSVVDDREALHL